MREIKYKYYVVRENGFVFSKIFDIRDIEIGQSERFLENNHVGDLDKVLKRCQFTGLTDKNGKELYEGDYIKFTDKNNGYAKDELLAIKWNKGNFGFIVYNPKCCEVCRNGFGGISDLGEAICIGGELEIIGNIYENPELLNL